MESISSSKQVRCEVKERVAQISISLAKKVLVYYTKHCNSLLGRLQVPYFVRIMEPIDLGNHM